MKKYEYKVDIFIARGFFGLDSRRNKMHLAEKLNQEGRHGWDLCTMQPTSFFSTEHILIFKRKVSVD